VRSVPLWCDQLLFCYDFLLIINNELPLLPKIQPQRAAPSVGNPL
jgi:hypothetical protein